MQDIYHIQTDYVKDSIQKQKIAISLRRDGFSFVIHNLESEKIVALYYKNISEDISDKLYLSELQTFLNNELIQQSFESISVIYVTPKTTIIPAALFKQEDLKLIFTCNYTLEPTEEIHYYKIKNFESYLVYAIPESIVNICFNSIKQRIDFYPQTASFIESSILQNKLIKERTLYISLESSFFDVVLLEGQKIILYNTFTFTNVNDYIYYVMNIFEQIQLHPLQTKIVLSGKISKSSNYFESTKMFVKNVTTVEPFPSQKELFHYPFDKVSYPLFSNLCNMSLCE